MFRNVWYLFKYSEKNSAWTKYNFLQHESALYIGWSNYNTTYYTHLLHNHLLHIYLLGYGDTHFLPSRKLWFDKEI